MPPVPDEDDLPQDGSAYGAPQAAPAPLPEPLAEPLATRFRRLIAHTGPISLAHYMAEANAHYYGSRDPFGSGGDFITAPEVSQMFGEMIGLWLADIWTRAGRPDPVHYVELGPGRGTLARDALGAAARHGLVPMVHFVETSLSLKAIQLEAVPQAQWHQDLSTVPDWGCVLIVANEFLDALPVRQLLRTRHGWRERMVGLVNGSLAFVAGDRPMDVAIPPVHADAPEGAILETCPAATAVVYEVAGRLAAQGGAALVIDYGHASPRLGTTLQAVRAHRMVDPLAAPGEADLTAHVDFSMLGPVAAARGARHLGTVEQGPFLASLGIGVRAEALARSNPAQIGKVTFALERLTGEGQMGRLFKVMGLAGPDWPDGAGF